MWGRARGVAIVGLLLTGSGFAAEVASPSDAGLYAGSEIMFFKPFAEAGSVPNEILTFTGADEFLPAWRLWGGYADEDGFGSRVRWWQYDQISANAAGYTSRLTFQKLDWEATQQMRFRHWQVLVSGGLTYIANGLGQSGPTETGTTRPYRFDGVGVTAGLQATRRSIRWPSIVLQGGVQWSAAYGNSVATQWDSYPYSASSRSLQGTTASILELAVGPRWERTLANGTVVFAGGNAEAQLWMTGLGATSYSLLPFYTRSGDVGLVGLTINAGFRR